MQTLKQTQRLLQRLKNISGPRPFLFTIAVLLVLFVVLITVPESTNRLEFYLYDLKQLAASAFRSANPSLAVVGIDMPTIESSQKRWPWPRQDMAEVLRCLARLKPRGIIVDILFQNAETQTGDALLEQVIAEQNNLIMISLLEEQRTSQGLSLVKYSSLPVFSEKAMAEGFVWGVINSDGRLRNFRISDDRLNAFSAAFFAYQHFFKADPAKVANLPAEAPVVFARKNGGIPVISLQDITTNEDQYKEFCRNKILFLGVNAPAVHDYHNTPIGIISGVEILASSVDTLISNRIGKIVFNNVFFRFIMTLIGMFTGWFGVMASWSILITPLVFTGAVIGLLTLSEVLLFHPPIVVMIISWASSGLIFYVAKYLDNLFCLHAMQKEADNARLVQEQLLPGDKLSWNGYNIFGVSRPANELGGDYFDYFLVNNRYLLAIIGDATGHGIPSALAMAIGKAAVLISVENAHTPEQLVRSINSVLFNALRRKLMMTAAVIWVDTETNEFEYLNCGHPYPYILKKDGSIEQLASGGLFLGTKANYKASASYKGFLEPDERILFYTDGLIESLPVTNEQDAYDVFREYLAKRPRLPPSEACHDILNQHPHFSSGQPQPDDFTVMMIERQRNLSL